jgi:hypothetical protein
MKTERSGRCDRSLDCVVCEKIESQQCLSKLLILMQFLSITVPGGIRRNTLTPLLQVAWADLRTAVPAVAT